MRRLLIVNFLSLAANTAVGANIPSLPPGWSYIGCLYEGNGMRIMTDDFLGTNDMTIQDCVTYCQGIKHTPYAALEVGNQCFCGSHLDYVRPMAESNCQYPCVGDTTQKCGGYGYMTFFSKTDQDPRISAGLINPSSSPTSTSTSAKSSATISVPNNPTQSQSGSSGIVSSFMYTSTSASPGIMSNGAPIVSPPLIQTQPTGFALPSDITAPSPQSIPSTSLPPGFSAPPQTVRQSTSARRAVADIPTAAIADNAGQGGIPKFQDYSKMIVYGKYASASTRTVQLSFFSMSLAFLVFWVLAL